MNDHVPSTEFERVVAENARFVARFDRSGLPARPARKLAVLACMDARIPIEDVLGIRTGDAHVIRNAGGLATDDAIRSLVLSQQLLGTAEVIVIEHTQCGLLALREEELRSDLAARTSHEADLPFHGFSDLDANLRAQVARIRAHPWTKDVPVHGLVYEVETGRLREVG